MRLVKINKTIIGMLAGIFILFYLISGLTGLRIALTVFFMFFIPIYFILDNFKLKDSEKIIFAFFLGIGIVPSITYYLGILLSSIVLAAILTFAVLIALAFLIKHKKNKKHRIEPAETYGAGEGPSSDAGAAAV